MTRAGGANGTGTVFKIARDGTGFTTLHVFGEITSPPEKNITKNADGAYPAGSLLESNGYFYGTANRGGKYGRGTVFRLRFDGSEFALLHVFTNIVAPTGSTVAVNEDGAAPLAGLLDGGTDGVLYGVASLGGKKGVGVLFSINPDPISPDFKTLHNFATTKGSQPAATPTLGLPPSGVDTLLYGTTSGGGTNSDGDATSFGTIWSMTRIGEDWDFKKIYSFDGAAGAGPNSAMLRLSSSVFVGTTSAAGRCGEGTVFRLSLTGDEIEGQTSCGQGNNSNDSGGGVIDPPGSPCLGCSVGRASCAGGARIGDR